MSVTEDLQNSVLILSLHHAKRTTPWTLATMQQLQQALVDVNSRSDISAVIVTGETKRAYSLGGDLDELKQLAQAQALPQWIQAKTDLFNTILDLEKPIIAAIDRYCIGLGLVTSLLFDWRIATDKTQFSLPEIANGIEGSIVVETVAATLTLNASRRLLYKSDLMNSAEALSIGLVDDVVSAQQLMERSLHMAQRLGQLPHQTFKSTKQSIMRHLKSALDLASLKDAAFITESTMFQS